MPAVVFSRRRYEPSGTSQRPQNPEHATRSSPLPVVTESKTHLHIPLPSSTFSIGQKNIKPLHEAIFLAKDVSGLLSPDTSRLRKRHLHRRASVIGFLSNSTVSISPTQSSPHSPSIQLAPTAMSSSEAFSEMLTLTILSETLASTIQQSPTSSQVEHIIDSVVQVISTPSVMYLASTASTARRSPPTMSQNTPSSAVPYFHSLPSVRPLEVSSTISFTSPTAVVSTFSASLTTTSSISITTPYVSNPTSLPPAYTFTSQSTTTSYLSTSVTSISSTYVDSSSSSSVTTTTNQYSERSVTSSMDFGPPQRVTDTHLRATTVTATITKTVVASQTQYQELIQPTTSSIVSLPSILAPLVVSPHSTLIDGNRPKTAPSSTTAKDGAHSSTVTPTPKPTSNVTSSFPSNTAQSTVPSSMQGKPLSPGNVSASHSSGSLPLILSVVTASFAFCLVMVLAVLYFRRRSQDRRFRQLY